MNNKLLLAGGGILVVLLIAGGIFLFLNNQGSSSDAGDEVVEENFIELSAEDIGLTVETDPDENLVMLEITEISEIEEFEFDVTYDAIQNGETVVLGASASGPNEDDLEGSSYTRELYLGTCSATCTPSTGVSNVFLEGRVDFKNGESGLIELQIPYE